MTTMITANRERVRGKSVLLFSGGMDSLIMNRLLKPDVLLVVSMGADYEDREFGSILNLSKHGDIDGGKVKILYDVLGLRAYERDDAIVPNRNAHLVLLASMYGETIWIGAVSGDRSYDKDEQFCAHMKALLDHMWEEQHWTERRTFRVEIPFKILTKTRMVANYLMCGGSAASLLRSYSCYSNAQPCGHCKPCFRKWVALVNNDIVIPPNYFAADPAQAPWLPELLPAIRAGKYRGAEDADIARALEHAR